jgi:hypothetical protein
MRKMSKYMLTFPSISMHNKASSFCIVYLFLQLIRCDFCYAKVNVVKNYNHAKNSEKALLCKDFVI